MLCGWQPHSVFGFENIEHLELIDKLYICSPGTEMKICRIEDFFGLIGIQRFAVEAVDREGEDVEAG